MKNFFHYLRIVTLLAILMGSFIYWMGNPFGKFVLISAAIVGVATMLEADPLWKRSR